MLLEENVMVKINRPMGEGKLRKSLREKASKADTFFWSGEKMQPRPSSVS
jgi:hypothetical protein